MNIRILGSVDYERSFVRFATKFQLRSLLCQHYLHLV